MPGPHVRARSLPNRCGLAGQMEQVVALVLGQAQRPGQRAQHSRRRVRPALLLEARVVVRRDRGERGHLVTAQTRRAAPPALVQADVTGTQSLASGPEQIGKSGTIHPSTVPTRAGIIQGPPIPGTARVG